MCLHSNVLSAISLSSAPTLVEGCMSSIWAYVARYLWQFYRTIIVLLILQYKIAHVIYKFEWMKRIWYCKSNHLNLSSLLLNTKSQSVNFVLTLWNWLTLHDDWIPVLWNWKTEVLIRLNDWIAFIKLKYNFDVQFLAKLNEINIKGAIIFFGMGRSQIYKKLASIKLRPPTTTTDTPPPQRAKIVLKSIFWTK